MSPRQGLKFPIVTINSRLHLSEPPNGLCWFASPCFLCCNLFASKQYRFTLKSLNFTCFPQSDFNLEKRKAMNNFYRDNTEGKERAKRPGTGFKSLVLIIIAIVPKMYGDLANKLILEAKRTQQLSQAGFNKQQLPVYQDELVRGILKEVGSLKKNVDYLREQQLTDQDNKVAQCQYVVAMLSMERNKRCLLAYQKMRSEMLDSMVWDNNGMEFSSAISNHPNLSSFDSSVLSHAEQEYLKEYAQLLTELKSGELSEIDLTGMLQPPSDVFIDVRVLKDAGQIETEYGVFNLIKDSQFFVRQSDVERLIHQGYLQKI